MLLFYALVPKEQEVPKEPPTSLREAEAKEQLALGMLFPPVSHDDADMSWLPACCIMLYVRPSQILHPTEASRLAFHRSERLYHIYCRPIHYSTPFYGRTATSRRFNRSKW